MPPTARARGCLLKLDEFWLTLAKLRITCQVNALITRQWCISNKTQTFSLRHQAYTDAAGGVGLRRLASILRCWFQFFMATWLVRKMMKRQKPYEADVLQLMFFAATAIAN
jgi:hypothetical protein